MLLRTAETSSNKQAGGCKGAFDLNQGLLKPGEKHQQRVEPLPPHTQKHRGRVTPSAAPCGPSGWPAASSGFSLAEVFKRQLWVKALGYVLKVKLVEMGSERNSEFSLFTKYAEHSGVKFCHATRNLGG